jgi:hypothetical protein
VRGDSAEHLADEAGRGPVRQRDRSAGPADAHELGSRLLVVWREHHTDARQHRIERSVREGQPLGVALGKHDAEALGGGALAAALEQPLDVIDAGHLAAAAGRRDRRVAVPVATSSTASPARSPAGLDEALRHQHDPRRDRAVVAAGPRPALALLDGG